MKKRVALGFLLCLGVAFAWFSVDTCGEWEPNVPMISSTSQGAGAFQVGASKVDFEIPFPIVVAGHAPLRSDTTEQKTPLSARAVVIDSGGTKVALVSLEVLFVTQTLQQAIEAEFSFPVIVTATHTHSSLGQFDVRLASQVAALGRYRDDCFQRIVKAARQALKEAASRQVLVSVQSQHANASLCHARSGTGCDDSIFALEFLRLADSHRVARILLLSAHPTYEKQLHGDWPNLVSAHDELGDRGVTLVFQTSVGNASADKAHFTSSQAYAVEVLKRIDEVKKTYFDDHSISFARVGFSLPRPDATRLVPSVLQPLVENVLCENSAKVSTVTSLRLGTERFLFVPGEATFNSGAKLSPGGEHVVSLAQDYVGYFEEENDVMASLGEAKRQYFGPQLFSRIQSAATLANKLSP